MPAVNWLATQNSYTTKSALINANVGRADWIGFLDALGWMENSGAYGGAGGSGGAYNGMYQVDNTQLNYMSFYTSIGDDLLGASDSADFRNSPVAQDLAAIMEFSGINMPGTNAFVSKYTAARLAARDAYPTLFANWNSLLDQTITINYTNAQGAVIGSQTVTLSLAGLSGAAHLIGQGALASALNAIYTQCFDANGVLLTSTANLSAQGNFADGNGIAFSNYILLFQNYDLSPLINAPDNVATFNGFAEQLLTHRRDKIQTYLTTNNRDIELDVSDDYKDTIKSIVTAFGLPTDKVLGRADGVVVIGTKATNKYTEDNDVIFHLGSTAATLSGGGGWDSLYGGGGGDTLEGGDGRDYLNGKEGADTLKGGDDIDYYNVDDGDTIIDSDGRGQVFYRNRQLTGGSRGESDPENIYRDGSGNVYVLSGTTLTINGVITIQDYDKEKHSLEIVLNDPDDDDDDDDGDSDDEGPSTDEASTRTSPIAIDLDGDGVETLALGATYFDHDGNGLREKTGWVKSDDGLLAYDRNGDGRINNGSELFGSNSVLANGQRAENGFQALAEFDDNGDGVVDALDASYASLRVWRDLNGNGVSDAGELLALADAGVASIGTGYSNSTHVDANGHEHRQVATVVLSNGTASTAADVWFKVDAGERVNSGDIELTADVLFLPNAKGFGKVQDLRQAMALDPQLMTALEQYLAATDPVAKDQLLDTLIYRWAGADGVDPYSRDPRRVYGHVMDARQLVTLENLVGHGYMGVWCWGEFDPNPHGQAAPLLIAEYLEFKRYTAAQLAAQTEYAEDLDFIQSAFGSDSQGTVVDWDALQGRLTVLFANGDIDRIAGIIAVLTDLGTYSSGYRAKRDAAFQGIAASSVELAPFFDFSSRIGTAQNDTLYGTSASSIFYGLAGNDRLYGYGNGDSYHFSRGHGNDTVLDRGGLDQIVLGEGITQADLAFTRNATTVWIHVRNADGSDAGSIRIDNFFDFDGTLDFGAVELIRFANGTSLSQAQMLAILTAASITSGNDLVFGTASGDTIDALAGNDNLHGLAGDDQLSGGAGDDEVMGDDGADTLSGGAGNDSLVGGRGSDTYLFNVGDGKDVISNAAESTGAKLDRLVFGAGIDPATVQVKRVGADLLLQLSAGDSVHITNYFSGEGADGTAVDEIAFHDGTVWRIADIKTRVLAATQGADVISGYVSNDVLSGLAGDDQLFGNGGDDTLDGGEGDDILDGGVGGDTLTGAAGNDSLRGGEGDDLLDGGADQDSLQGASGDDTLLGGAGNDTLDGGAGRDILQGGQGSDWLGGSAGDDTLTGGSGNDILSGGTGSDVYRFDAGDGQDNIDNYDYGEDRVDELVFGVGIDPASVTARRSGDSLVLTFAGNDDKVTVDNYFQGDAAGSYRLDLIRFADGSVWNVDTVKSLVLAPTTGADVLRGYESADTLDGGGGNDTLYGQGGDDTLQGQDGDDTILGGTGNDVAFGGSGDDVLSGEDGKDVLDGGTGNDTLRGGMGVDRLTGRLGDDLLEGGDDDDFYYFAAGDGHDTIRDTVGLSTIYLSGLPLNEVYFRREGTALAVRFLNSSNDQILLADFFDPFTELAMHSLRFDMGDGQFWVLDAAGLDAASLAGTTLDDVIHGNTLGNVIQGLAGNDTLYGGGGQDDLDGGSGNDVLDGQDGNDLLKGGEGDDLLDGGIGADQLQGGAGDDTYVVDHAGDVVGELTGSGRDVIHSSVSFTLPDNVEEVLLTGSNDIGAVGNGNANVLTGNYGNNHLQGLGGNDALAGGDGNDTLEGGVGDDVLDGGSGVDALLGDAGSDLYRVDDSGDIVTELASEGDDVVESSAYEYTLSANVETLVLVEGSGAHAATGSADDNVLIGNSSSNRLDGAAGTDRMEGGAGDDTYVVDNVGDIVAELADEGSDTVESSIDYTLGATLENLVLTGEAHLNGTGNDGDNVLVGNSGNNRLDGGLGGDDMYGGAGDDYFINNTNQDWMFENEGEGADTVERRYETNLVLSDNVENLILVEGIKTGNGNELDNTITGNSGANTLGGWDGDDVLHGLDGDDSLFGGTGSDVVLGGNGGDYLDGGEGVDRLEGGAGNDVYVTDDAGDVVVEAANSGIDQVQTTATYALSDNIENLFLMGSGAIGGTGNALDNYIAGNGAANVIHGLGGSDTIVAGGGNDTLLGGAGDDKYVVNATSGTDTVDNTGGGFDGLFFTDGIVRDRLSFARDGNDLLISVDNATTTSVRVVNHFLGGDAAIDYVQPDGGSYLTTAQINQIVAGGGTGFDQVIEGTAAGEQLVGGSGKDLIKGLAGADQLFGMGGNDTLQGGDGDDYLSGGNGSGSGSADDRLEGGIGNDTLAGEDGNDALIGGAGDDDYVYGGGQDVIDNTGGGYDGVFFNNGITAAQLAFTRSGDDLVITVGGNAANTMTVTNHFLGGDSAIDYVQPASGAMLDTAAINALVGGGGNPPGGGDDGDYPSVVTGTAAGEQLLGTNGRDLIKGLGGNDTVFGFNGDDKLDGGDGDDYLSGGNGSHNGSGNDILIGGAGVDQLVGEDGDDQMFGGLGNDKYIYGGGADTIDNTGGGTDWLHFNSSAFNVARDRITFHRDADDLIVRVDGDAAKQVRVLKHFLGGEYAIAYVQPGSGNAIPASQFSGLLTPLSSIAPTTQLASETPLALTAAIAVESMEAPVASSIPDWQDAMEVFGEHATTPSAANDPAPPSRELQSLVEAMSSFSAASDGLAAGDGAEGRFERHFWSNGLHQSHRNDSARLRYMEQ